ncbi:phosphatases II [Cucurbitaria berberidis CBS 394.84]|uniref:Phosphatases II n=1 Tax=Cucurbitaria berberidis CBS 394.84 TaxID=1168544 RepID=A0A9P4L9H7_9PLEO|nr:phosphatases II [Cucurbitaria berberidis CBS 394.84]KAF1846229.1 phosphatases II [Cucurbitaria berberidis CBS 394.84]
MSYLLHGSTAYTGMGWVDQVPRAGKLYIGGLYALYTDLIRAEGITHVLSIIDYDALLQEKFPHLKHHLIRADDHPNENLLQYFHEGVDYIDQALREANQDSSKAPGNGKEDDKGAGGGGVFVHCAMGKSRSATLVVAYLMWKYRLDSTTALEQLCEARPVCDPNPGFKEQLQVWEKMCKTEKEEEKKAIYDDWEKTRFMGEYWEWDARRRGTSSNL